MEVYGSIPYIINDSPKLHLWPMSVYLTVIAIVVVVVTAKTSSYFVMRFFIDLSNKSLLQAQVV